MLYYIKNKVRYAIHVARKVKQQLCIGKIASCIKFIQYIQPRQYYIFDNQWCYLVSELVILDTNLNFHHYMCYLLTSFINWGFTVILVYLWMKWRCTESICYCSHAGLVTSIWATHGFHMFLNSTPIHVNFII